MLRRAGLAIALGLALGACSLFQAKPGPSPPVTESTDLITPKAAHDVVVHHWSVNRDALQQHDANKVRDIMSSIETGPALAADLHGILGHLSAGQSNPSFKLADRPADQHDINVFVPHQRTYPGVFIAVASYPQAVPPGSLSWGLEAFVKNDPHDGWKQSMYAAVDDPGGAVDKVKVDPDGFAESGSGDGAVRDLSSKYADYMNGYLGSGAAPASAAFAAGAHTSGLGDMVRTSITAWRTHAEGDLAFAYRGGQDAPLPLALNTSDGGRLAVFSANVDITHTAAGGVCLVQDSTHTYLEDAIDPGAYRSAVVHGVDFIAAHVPASGVATVRAFGYLSGTADSKNCY